jgi:Ca-activated chloride channel family protein
MRATTTSLSLSLVLGAAACSGSSPARGPAVGADELVARPAPGMDLAGPVAPPAAVAAVAGAAPEPLDLGVDRPAVAVDVPAPPRGGAAAFTFGEDRRGWVTRIPETNQLPSVAYGDGRIYVSGGFESVSFYALDAKDGRVVWASQQLEDNGPTAPIFEDDRVVFNTESCTLFVMEAATGKKIWFKYLGDPTLSQPAVTEGLVYAAHPSAGGHNLTAYKVKNGDVVWTRAIGNELLAAPVIHGDSVYATNLNGRVYRFRHRTGKLVWAKSLKATTAPWLDGDKLYVTRRAPRAEQTIVVSIADGAVIGEHAPVPAKYLADIPTNLNDWKKVWAFEGSRPVVADGVKYEAMAGYVQAGDPSTGDARWKRRWADGPDKRSLGAVALAGPQVVVSTRGGEIFGLDIDTGYTLWAYDVGKTIVAQPIVADGWVYASTTDGTVIALEVADSSLDGWHMWGGNPHHNGPVSEDS